MNNDPFADYRTQQPSFDSVTGSDGRSLALSATTDLAAFHHIANAALEITNRSGWRIVTMHKSHPGANIQRLMLTPRR